MKFLLILVISSSMAGLVSRHRAENPVPFLYYYSFEQQGFIIEQADGTDSRLLASGLTNPQHDQITLTGWSPSGRWLAWESTGDDSAQAYVIRVDGQQTIQLRETSVYRMLWSSVDDYLLVVGNLNEQLTATIYDIEDNRSVVKVTLAEGDGMIEANWSPDGRQALVTKSAGIQQQLYLLNTDGSQTEIHTEGQTCYTEAFWHSDGRLAYFDQQTLVLGDNTIPLPFAYPYQIFWSGDDALVAGSNASCREQVVEIWLLTPDGQMEQVLSEAEAGFGVPLVSWSDDGQHALMLGRDKSYRLFTLADRSLIETTMTNDFYDEYRTSIIWQNDSVLVGSGDRGYQYDLATGTQTDMPQWYHSLSLSPDQQTLLYAGDCLATESYAPPPCLQDMQASTSTFIAPYSGVVKASLGFFESDWHPGSEWVLIEEIGNLAGGHLDSHFSVIHRSGTGHRELTAYCDCAAWLPDQVDLEALPAVSNIPLNPAPDRVLSGHTSPVWAVAWSPDGSKIASVEEAGLLFIRDVATGEVSQRIEVAMTGAYSALAWSLDGQRLALLDRSGEISLWEAETGRRIRQFARANSEWASFDPDIILNSDMTAYAIDSSGEQLAAQSLDFYATVTSTLQPVTLAYDDYYCQSDPLTVTIGMEPAIRLQEAFDHCYADILINQDNRLLAGVGHQVQVWDLTTGRSVFYKDVDSMAVAFSPDGQWVAIGASYEVRLWRLGQ